MWSDSPKKVKKKKRKGYSQFPGFEVAERKGFYFFGKGEPVASFILEGEGAKKLAVIKKGVAQDLYAGKGVFGGDSQLSFQKKKTNQRGKGRGICDQKKGAETFSRDPSGKGEKGERSRLFGYKGKTGQCIQGKRYSILLENKQGVIEKRGHPSSEEGRLCIAMKGR